MFTLDYIQKQDFSTDECFNTADAILIFAFISIQKHLDILLKQQLHEKKINKTQTYQIQDINHANSLH